jgi:aminopeptidase
MRLLKPFRDSVIKAYKAEKEFVMNDPRIHKWADVLTQYSAPVQPGHQVVIRGTTLAEPLILELVRAVLERDAFPLVRMEPSELNEVVFRHASDRVLDQVPDLARVEVEWLDVIFRVKSDSNTRALNNVDPAKILRQQRARRSLSELQLKRSLAGELLWCSTLFPTPAHAQDAEMSQREYTEFVFDACFLNEDDPIARWQKLAERQQRLVEYLDTAREVHVKAPGTDLRLGIAGRTWVNARGTNNFPCGEVSTGPVETEVNGHVTFNIPGIYAGRAVRGIQLWFEDGRVVKALAEHNQDLLHTVLDTDEGSRYLGEFSFGTNYNIRRSTGTILFDEKMGGTIHMALGRSYPESGGKNVSAIHWDIICDLRQDSKVYVDGELFQENGRFAMLEGGVV